jgi:hypothetical protein
MRRTWRSKVLCQLEFCSYSCVGIWVQGQGQAFGNLSSMSHSGRKGTNVERRASKFGAFTCRRVAYVKLISPSINKASTSPKPPSPHRTISADMEAESSKMASTRSRKKRKSEGNGDPPDPPHEDTKKPKPMRRRAAKLAGLLDLPLDILFEVCLSYM